MYARFDREGFFIIVNAYLAQGMPNEALKYLSKSLAITKAGDRRPWFRVLSDTYAGMEDKAKEYDARLTRRRNGGRPEHLNTFF